MQRLTRFGSELWLAEGSPVIGAMGFRFPTRMAVMRLPSGDVVVWSPVGLTADLRGEIDAIGAVRHVLAPNAFHHLFLAQWQKAFPEAAFHAPPGLRAKRPDVHFSADLTDTGTHDWQGHIRCILVAGNAVLREYVFFHESSRTVLFTDLLQAMPVDWYSGWRAVIGRWDRMTGDKPAVPRKFRIAFHNQLAARAAIATILSWPIERLVMAHGSPIERGDKRAISDAFDWLGPF